MKETFHRNVSLTILIAILGILAFSIVYINFSSVPGFYDADMYCDYRYAMEAWKYKSLFPDGWIFGNQLNAVSTPVLAAVIFGFTDHINFSMAAACSIMAVLVMICFDWMLKPVLKTVESRLMAAVLLITVCLYCGNAVQGNQGWTLLFTMCSYYAGYSITAFLAFGCYLRARMGYSGKLAAIVVLTCILSFGTGIQSIRQTAIMICPMLAVEFFRLVFSFQEWKKNKTPLWVTLGISVANILGLIYVRIMPINQYQVFGEINLISLGDLKNSLEGSFSLIQDLLRANAKEDLLVSVIMGVVCIGALFLILKNVRKENGSSTVTLMLLIVFSVLIILVVDIFTTMYVRPRYYFMLYPLIAFLAAYVYDKRNRILQYSLLALVVAFFCVASVRNFPGVYEDIKKEKNAETHAISQYLTENGYGTIYAEWMLAQDIAVASDGALAVGYWYVEEEPFEKVTHLSNEQIYSEDAPYCVYLFKGADDAQIGIDVADSLGVPLEFLQHFPERDIFIYTASENLMQVLATQGIVK